MTSISNDFRGVLSRHIEGAPSHKILLIANAIAQLEDPPKFASPAVPRPRFEILDDDLVTDRQTGLTWLRYYVPGGKRNHADSVAAASAFTLNGRQFRAPTISERLGINDYERHSPAIDTSVFHSEPSGWEWTTTPDAESPSVCAWVVGFDDGGSVRGGRSSYGWVRGVRVGQF